MLPLQNALLSLSFSAAVAYGINASAQPNYTRMATKTTSVGLLAIVTWLADGPPLLVAAQALSAAGDAFLSWDGDNSFLSGLASFLTSHVLYVTLFSHNGGGMAQILSPTWRILAAGLMVLLAPTMVVALMPRVGRDLRGPVVVYATAILAMVLAALTMNNNRIAFGAIIFTASDAILAADRFLISPTSAHRVWMQYVVWVLYYVGQRLIMLGMLNSM